jgi:UDP-glucose 4-epimerase
VVADICDPQAVQAALHGVDAVVHLAAEASVAQSVRDPLFNARTNVLGTLTLLEAMRASGVRRLVNASTDGAIVEERAISPYGASKKCAEVYCQAFADAHGLDVLSLRLANVYGPGSRDQESVIPTFLKRLLAGAPLTLYGDGGQTRDFIYVEDVCDGVVRALRRPCAGVLPLGSGAAVSIRELAARLAEITGLSPVQVRREPARTGEVAHARTDPEPARRMLGFEAAISFAEGLERTWRWFAAETPLFTAA